LVANSGYFLNYFWGQIRAGLIQLSVIACRQAVAWQGQLPIGQAELSVCGRVRLVTDWLIG